MGEPAVQDPAADADTDPDVTEIVKLMADQVDGVFAPANGINFLLMKGMAGDPDDPNSAPGATGCGCCAACKCPPPVPAGGQPANNAGGPPLTPAAPCKCGCADCRCANPAVGSPPVPPMVTKTAADMTDDEIGALAKEEEDWLAELLPANLAKASRKFPAAQRRKYAGQGTALADGSYPMPDADAVRRAAILIRAKKGKFKAAARLLGKRVIALGIPNPLKKKKVAKAMGTNAGTASASQYPGDGGGSAAAAMVAPGPTAGATTPPKPRKKKKKNRGGDNSAGAQTQVALKDVIDYDDPQFAAAVAKAASTEVAKALAQHPAPGGPVTSVPRSATAVTEAREENLSKAARYRELADQVSDRQQAQNYRDMAREAEAAAGAQPAAS